MPYALTHVCVIALRMIRTLISGGCLFYTFRLFLNSALYGSGSIVEPFFARRGIPMIDCSYVWFLLALFFGRICMMYILKWGRNTLLITAAVSYLGYGLGQWFWLPFSFCVGLSCVIFLYVGYYIRSKDLFADKAIPLPAKAVMLLAWGMCVYFGKSRSLEMVSNRYNYGLLSILIAVCAAFIVIDISKWIARYLPPLRRFFSFLGRRTLPILCGHCIASRCWPQSRITPYLEPYLPLPTWAISALCLTGMTFLVTGVLYFLPFMNRAFFPGARILGVYDKILARIKAKMRKI